MSLTITTISTKADRTPSPEVRRERLAHAAARRNRDGTSIGDAIRTNSEAGTSRAPQEEESPESAAPIWSQTGSIIAGTDGNIVSSYTFRWSWTNQQTEVTFPISFNINADIPVPSFRGVELAVEYHSRQQPRGFVSFDGIIGGGRIYITIRGSSADGSPNIIIKGGIEGGPTEGQSFVGSGTWVSAA